jgi:hypothetical protein
MLAACVAQSRNYVASGGLLVVDLFRIHHRSARIVVPFRDNGCNTFRWPHDTEFVKAYNATLSGMPMSLDSIDHNERSLDVREFLSLGDEFSPRGGGLGSDPESSRRRPLLNISSKNPQTLYGQF